MRGAAVASIAVGLLIATPAATGASFGTLLAEDPAGDTFFWGDDGTDLRELWFASDGTFLNVTIVVEDLEDPLLGTEWSVEFESENAPEPGAAHDLECRAGTVGGEVPPSAPDCQFTVVHSQDCTAGVCSFDFEVHDVEETFDPDGEFIQASIPYAHFLGQSGGTLDVIESTSWRCSQSFGSICLGADNNDADGTYTLK